jgi:acetylornithine/succinyldiaminopimelate/putrescine aminotransferase
MNNFSSEIFLKHIAQTTQSPINLTVERAEGLYLYDPDGKAYMDLISGVSVSNLGHRHPRVVEAIKKQVDEHMHVMVYGEFIQSSPNLLAQRLAKLLPDSLDCCYFTNSGAEAIEGALKLAKRYTGRTEIVSFRKSYHGSTHGALSVSGNETKKQAFRPLLPDVRFINFNEPADLSQITERTACVIMETIQGDAGVRIPDIAYMKALRKRCTEVGALLILDEIQTGIGRTGKMFGFEHFEIVPDIVCLAKALGGGLPIGTFISSHAIMQSLTENPMLGHITTFGGNPVACAAANATLQVIEEENLLAAVEEKGQLFEELLKHDAIKTIRRKGLFFAIEFETQEQVFALAEECLKQGAVTFWFLSIPNAFRIAPPLNITEHEIRKACDIIIKAINKVIG